MRKFKEPTPSQWRQLEKRYGDVKELVRKRAEELGQDMSTSLKRIDDVKKIAKHMETYNGTEMGLIVSNIRNVVNLYEVPINGKTEETHVVWVFKDLNEFVKNRYRINAYLRSPVDMLYGIANPDLLLRFEKLADKTLDSIYKNPYLMPKIEEFLLGAYAKAVEFYNWDNIPRGIVISGWNSFAYAPILQTIIYGNDALGIGIGKQLLNDIILQEKPEKYLKYETTVVSLLIHELTHLHRLDPCEVPEYAVMLLVDPKNNFNIKMLENGYDKMIAAQEQLDDHDIFKHIRDYEIERYIGIILMANEFAKYNSKIRQLFAEDETPNKLRATRDFLRLVRNSDIEKVKNSDFMHKLLNGYTAELVEQLEIIDDE